MLKKVLSLLLVLTLVLSMGVTAFATGTDEITGEGDTTYVDTDKFVFLLPTANAWDFTLDPQGLVGAYKDGLFDGATSGVTSGDLDQFAGKIIANNYAPVAVNQSSYKTTLAVKMTIESDDVVVLTEGDDVAEDTENNVIINALLSDVSVTDQTATFGVTNPVKVPLSTTEQTLGFVLENPEYVYTTADGSTFEYELADVDSGFGTQIQLGGEVNPTADWSDFAGDDATKEISVTAKFSFTKSTEEEITKLADEPVAGAYGYVGLLGDSVPDGIGYIVSGATERNAAITLPTGITDNLIPFAFDGKNIVYVGIVAAGGWDDITSYVSKSGNNLVFNTDQWLEGTYTIAVYVDDDDEAYEMTLTVTAAP